MFSSVQFSPSVMSDCLWPHGLQHPRPTCPSPIPRIYPNSSPSSQWCHPTISSSVIPFSSCLQSFPASGSFQVSQFFGTRWPKYWSFSFSISPFNEYPGLISFQIDWFDLLAVQGTLKSLLQHSIVGSQCSDNYCVYIYPLFWGFPYHLGHHRALSRVTCAIQLSLVIYFIYISIYICQYHFSNSPYHTPHPPFTPWYICFLCLCLCFCFVNKIVCT